nr:unnamed protein product [Callosobruchus analis]
MVNCENCQTLISRTRPAVFCEVCKKSVHSTCISKIDILPAINNTHGLTWKCDECIRTCIVINQADILKMLDGKIEEVVAAIKKHVSSISEGISQSIRYSHNSTEDNQPVKYADVVKNKTKPALIIQSKNANQEVNKTKSDILSNANPAEAEVQLTRVRNVRDGGILIGCKSQEENRKLKAMVQEKLSDNYEVREVTESWLESSISDFELFPQTYSVYRSDRDFSSTSCTRGGGVLIAVAEHLSSTRVELDGDKSLSQLRIDVVVVKVKSVAGSICIVNLYIPPDTPNSDYEILFDTLLASSFLFGNNHILIVGDFNLMNYANYMITGDSDTKIQMLNSFVQIVNVKQFNNVYNKSNRILDLVFHNSDCVVSKSLNSFVKEDSHHPALDIHCKLGIAVNHKDNFPVMYNNCYNFKKANFTLMYDLILGTDWSLLTTFDDNAEENATSPTVESPKTEEPKTEEPPKAAEAPLTNGDASPAEECAKPAEEPKPAVEEAPKAAEEPAVKEEPVAEEPAKVEQAPPAAVEELTKEVRSDEEVPPPLPTSNPPNPVTVFAESTKADQFSATPQESKLVTSSQSTVETIPSSPPEPKTEELPKTEPVQVPPKEETPKEAVEVAEIPKEVEVPKEVAVTEEVPKEIEPAVTEKEVTEVPVEVKEAASNETVETKPETECPKEATEVPELSKETEERIEPLEPVEVSQPSNDTLAPLECPVEAPKETLDVTEASKESLEATEVPQEAAVVPEPCEDVKETPEAPKEPESLANGVETLETPKESLESTKTPEEVKVEQNGGSNVEAAPSDSPRCESLPDVSTESLPSLPEPMFDQLAEPMSLPPVDSVPEPIACSPPPAPEHPSPSPQVLTNGSATNSNGLPHSPVAAEEEHPAEVPPPAAVAGPVKQVLTEPLNEVRQEEVVKDNDTAVKTIAPWHQNV